MILVVDNYDSFTYNLVHFLGELGADPTVRRNDKITVEEVAGLGPAAIVLSPGPCTPNEAGICLDVVARMGADIPTLGVCLGHQSIAQAYGATIVRAPTLMHGKLSAIHHNGRSVFRGITNDFAATRYHSLTIDVDTVPEALEVTATTDDGTIMGIMHKSDPVHGVQFHPESIASEHGHHLLKNFLDIAATWNEKNRTRASVA
ncbi:MAG: aminodeoxychorismate/anthranilate synthase component II [Hyphomicrobiales bacterium]|nr:aminodeoxychorismate/anthranilate synthase component II [Hyphomicrobiales bacterium]